ncbi:MAG: hypothetical protein VR65_10855 [Desulfobulbaceae bacterium BRH_c16a]|nr:MAG: hypothetical protein VR65_10855 [Desulfobulbaceae bacterium BRH_c16a]
MSININDELLILPAPYSLAPRTDRHVLGGSVSVDGVATALQRVAVFHRYTLNLIAITRSLPDGSWKIDGIQEYGERDLLVLAIDDTGAYNSEVADHISQVTA